jgi:hypothetical protein
MSFPKPGRGLVSTAALNAAKRKPRQKIARRAQMIAPISYKSGYTYLGPDNATQRQRLLEGSAKTPRMETGGQVIVRSSRPRPAKRRRYELAGWEFKRDRQGVRRKRAILRELPGD